MENIKQTEKTNDTTNDAIIAPPVEKFSKFKTLLVHHKFWLIVALVVLISGIFAYNWAFGKDKKQYITDTVKRGNIENTVVAAGIIQPVRYVDVGAQTSGKLKSLKVKRGDQVKEGQLLAEIDPVLAQTALTAANATLENMTSQRSLREAQLVLAKLQWSRNEELFSQNVISASDHDISQANYDVAIADAASLSALMKQATASVNTAKANVGYTKITASMDGEVVSISLVEGQTLNANQQAPNILRIADLSIMTVWAQVSEADIVRVKSGQDVYFTVLGQTRRWNGKVRQILPTPELLNNVVFYNVLFDIPNTERDLHIQMTAQVFIVMAQAKNVLLIPTAIIGNVGDSADIKVQIMNASGDVEIRKVKIGIRSEISTEVISGLNENEEIVIKETTTKVKKKSALNVSKTR